MMALYLAYVVGGSTLLNVAILGQCLGAAAIYFGWEYLNE